jgi:YD repeat-containing protein
MVTDANGNQSSTSYNDAYSDGQNRNTYAFATAVTDAKGHTTNLQYDYGAGKPIWATDPNGIITGYAYTDPLDRVTQVRHAAGWGNSMESQTNYIYENPTWIVACQDQNVTTDCGIQTQRIFDGLGQPIENRTIEYGADDFIAVDTSYDALGRVYQSFNPSRINISSGVGDGLDYPTTYSYDALGRVTQVQTADGSKTTTSYAGNQTVVTDPALRVRQTSTDALGHLMQVAEDPSGLNYQTGYSVNTSPAGQ